MKIKTLLAGIALAAGCATPAFAADLYAPPVPAAAKWSGPYVGFHLGVGVDQDRSLSTGTATGVVTGGDGGGNGAGFCLNTSSGKPVPGLDTQEKCETRARAIRRTFGFPA